MAKKEVIVGEFGLDSSKDDNPHIQNDKLVLENLRAGYGVEAEASWRFYERSGLMKRTSREKDKAVVNAEYVPCPAPVKIDKNGGWSKDNCMRCNATIPKGLTGRDARDWAVAHQEIEHTEDWIERNSVEDKDGIRKGHAGPPTSSKVSFPKWASSEDEVKMMEMTESEKRIKKARDKMARSMSSKANIALLNEEKARKKAQEASEEKMVGESETV